MTTFKSYTGREMTIRRATDLDDDDPYNVAVDIANGNGTIEFDALFSDDDAPAIALAILEAAGWPIRNDGNTATGMIVEDLRRVVAISERQAKESAEQAQLEDDALVLFNASRSMEGGASVESWSGRKLTMAHWVFIAKVARAMHTPEAAL